MKLSCNLAQDIPADRIEITVGPEKTDDPLFLLKRLDQAIEQDAVETTILKSNAILVMLVERVHGMPPSGLRKPKG